MAKQGMGVFSNANTILQNNRVRIKFPKAYDKTNYDKNPDAIQYEIRYFMQPIYCHAEGVDYIAIDSSDNEIKTDWSLLSGVAVDEESANVLVANITIPSAATDVALQYEIRALDDYDSSPNREIKSNRFFAIKNDTAKLKITRMERVGEDQISIVGEVLSSGFSLPKNIDEIKNSSELQVKFASWRYDLGTIFGDLNFNFEYSHSATMSVPSTRVKITTPTYKLRTWEWFAEPFNIALSGFDKDKNYYFKFYLTRQGILASSNSNLYGVIDSNPSIVVVQSGTPSLQIANNGIRSNYPEPNDKVATAAAMLVKGQQHKVPNEDHGHSAALYDNTIPVGKTTPENKPSLGFLSMNHEELGSIGIESLFKPDGTNIGSYIVLRQEDSVMPVAIRSNGNRLQYWDEGLGIWQPILPAKMTKQMSEHIQWDFTGGETGTDPILIHMKGMTFSSTDGITFTVGSLTPESLSQELKDELSNRNLTLKASSYVYAVDSNDNPEPNAYIDFTADLQGISGEISWLFQGKWPDGTFQTIGSMHVSDTTRRVQMSSLNKSITTIIAKITVVHNGLTYQDTVEIPKIKHGSDGEAARGIVEVTEWLLASTKQSGVTRTDIGWTSDNYPTITKEVPYLWNYKTTEYTDGTFTHTDPVLIGSFGVDGRGISSVENFYVLSSLSEGVTIDGYEWSNTPPTPIEERPYLWNYDKINYHDGVNPTVVGPRVIGVHGARGEKGKDGEPGEDGAGIVTITEFYLASAASTGVTTETDGWSTTMTSLTPTNKYLWNYEKVEFTDGRHHITTPIIIGVHGEDGVDGSTGRSLTGITEYYLASSSSSGITRSSAGWTTSMQITTPEKPHLWNYEKLAWSSAPTTTYVEPVIIGVHGLPGQDGVPGVDKWTWVKYADDEMGTGMADDPAGKSWLGLAVNKETSIKSANPDDYTWSPLYQNAVYIGDTEPENPTSEQLWVDTSQTPSQLRQWIGGTWQTINDPSDFILSLSGKVDQGTLDLLLQEIEARIVDEMMTQFQQTNDSFNFEFQKWANVITDGDNANAERIEVYERYIRFIDGVIVIGENSSPFTLEISNEKISFLNSGREVAYASGGKFHMPNAQVENSLVFGVPGSAGLGMYNDPGGAGIIGRRV